MYKISLRDITIGYSPRILLKDINTAFAEGEFTAMIGQNGTGKSTLLRTMAGLMKPLGGEVLIKGEPLRGKSNKEIAALVSFVSTEEVRIGSLRVYDVVGMGRAPYTNWIGSLSAEDKKEVDDALNLVGMSEFAGKSIDSLSDGERQRVMIARSLAQDTPIILLDEPTAFLDVPNKYEISMLLKSLARTHRKTIIVSTHDLNIALEMCDKIMLIDSASVTQGTPSEIINNHDIQRIFRGTGLYYDAIKGIVHR